MHGHGDGHRGGGGAPTDDDTALDARIENNPSLDRNTLGDLQADMHTNIDYLAPNGAPDNDRKMKEASWLTGQAFIESLRY